MAKPESFSSGAQLHLRMNTLVALFEVVVSFIASAMTGSANEVLAWGDNTYGQLDLPPGLTNGVAFAASGYHHLFLKSNGTVTAWGDNNFGQCNIPAGLSNVTGVAAGGVHSLALKVDGSMVGWGWSAYGVTGSPTGLSNVVAIAAGNYHNVALKSDGTVTVWGDSSLGQTSVPPGLSNVTAISAGNWHSLALRSDGTPVVWGHNGNGQTNMPAGLVNVMAVAAGSWHCMVLHSNGTVRVWGDCPIPPEGLSDVVAIAGGDGIGIALRRDKTLAVWGYANRLAVSEAPVNLTNVVLIGPAATAALVLVGDCYPQVTRPLVGSTNLAEEIFTFRTGAAGADPIQYQWRFNGTNLPGATQPSLVISNIQPSQGGGYSLVITNVCGWAASSTGVLAVLPLALTSHPVGQDVYGGDSTSFAVEARGSNLKYQWKLDGSPVTDSTNAVLTLSSITTNQAGDYSVSVSNVYGFVESSNATLTVVPIVITSPPSSLTRYVGDSASFSVAAAKNGPFTYQWRHDGVDMTGQTSASLNLANLVTNDAGSYSVFVSNPYGSLESSAATLTVVDSKPIITNQPASRGAYLGGSASFRVVADGTKPLSYQWLFNGTNVPGANAATLTLTNLTDTNAGIYAVWVSNSVGVTTSTPANLVFLNVVTWGATNSFGLGNIPLDLSNVFTVAGGNNHSVALKSDGRITAWGYNFVGQTIVPASATNVIAIAAGGDSTLALRSNGTVVAWGRLSTVPAGVSNVIAIAMGANHALALRSNGTVVAWGSGSATNVPPSASNIIAIAAGETFTAALKADRTVMAWGSSPSTSGMTNVVAIAAGDFPLVALKADGKVVAAGVLPVPANLSNVIGVAAGRYHALALRSDGTVTNWSINPTTPAGLTNLVAVASGQNHCLAILGDGPQPGLISFTDVKRISNSFSLSLPTQYGHLYWLEYKNSLSDPVWRSLPLSPGTGNPLPLTDSGATNATRFYRARWW